MARFQVQLLVFACFGVASSLASFQTDVVAKVNRKSFFPGLPSLLKKARRLDGHEGGEAMAKCMASPCGEKMGAMDSASEEEQMAAMCPLIECLKGEADCASMLAMFQDSPEMPKGMIGCLCDSGCDLAPMVSGTGGTEVMFTTVCCMTGADQCKDMLAGGEGMEEVTAMAPCICSADKEALKKFATGVELSGDCKDAPKKKDDEGSDEIDICKLQETAPDGACAKSLMPGWKALNSNADCAKLKEQMEKDMSDTEMTCVKDLEAAVAATEAAADFAQVAAVPPAAGLLLTTAAVAMAAL